MAANKPTEPYSDAQQFRNDVNNVMAEQIRTTEKLSNVVAALDKLTDKFDGVTSALARQQTLIEVMRSQMEISEAAHREQAARSEEEFKRLSAKDSEQDRVLLVWRGAFGVLIFVTPFAITMLLKLFGII